MAWGIPTATTNENRTTNLQNPPWTQGVAQNFGQAVYNMGMPHLQASPYHTAGLNADQTMAFDLARETALGQFGGGNPAMQGLAQQFANGGWQANAAQAGPAALSRAASMQAANAGQAAMAQAQQLGPTDYREFMNPFLDSVGKSTLGAMRNEYQNADARIAAQSAARGAFGGSGEAIARGQAARGHNEAVAQTISSLMAQGYDRATANAMANAQMRQQTELANQAAMNNMGQFNAGLAQQAGITNAGFAQQAGLANQAAMNNMGQFNAGLQQQANMQNPQNMLAAMMGLDRLDDASLARQRAVLQDLLGIGNQQQAFAQTAMDGNWRTAALMKSLFGDLPLDLTTTQTGSATAPTGGPSTGNQVVGILGDIAGQVITNVLGQRSQP